MCQRVQTLTGKILELKLTDEELKKEQQHYPYNFVERKGETLIYKVQYNNEEDEEIDDLPKNITNIIINHIETHTTKDKDINENNILTINNFYNKNNLKGGIFISTNINLPGVKGSWGELEYNEDKNLIIDYRYWPHEDGALLSIEDRYDTIYVEYNRQIEYLDPKIDLDKVLDCLKKKALNN